MCIVIARISCCPCWPYVDVLLSYLGNLFGCYRMQLESIGFRLLIFLACKVGKRMSLFDQNYESLLATYNVSSVQSNHIYHDNFVEIHIFSLKIITVQIILSSLC